MDIKNEVKVGFTSKQTKIFVCYAREDELLLRELEKHLTLLQRQGFIAVWHDREISPGVDWEQEIKKQLDMANIILFLVSPDFISSDYCYGVELQRAMERYRAGEVRIIPIILRPVYWQATPFGKIQALPTDARPVAGISWHSREEAFYDVAEGIRKAAMELHSQSLSGSSVVFSSSTPTQAAIPPSPTPVQRKHQRSPAVVGTLILFVLILLSGTSIEVYNTFTGHWPWNVSHGQPTLTASDKTAQANTNATAIAQINTLQATYDTVASRIPVLEESLTNDELGWERSGGSQFGCAFAENKPGYEAYDSGYPQACLNSQTNFSDFIYQIQVNPGTTQSGGIAFRASNGSSYYQFLITIGGSYIVNIVTAYNITATILSGSSSFIQKGSNDIAVLARGNNLAFFINKHYVNRVSDNNYHSGEIGVSVGGEGIQTFNYAKVWLL